MLSEAKKMKKLIISIQLLSICWIVFAQNDSTIIKLEQRPFYVEIDTSITVYPVVAECLQGKLIDPAISNEMGISGIEVKIEGPHSEKFSYGSTMSPISLDYMKEIKIFKTATFILKGGGVIIPKSLKSSYFGQIISKPLIGDEFNYLNFGLNFVIEPRWYWKTSKKTLSGKVKQNSGWYLSFPFEANIPIDFAINTFEENYNFNDFSDVIWIKDFLRFYYNLGPAIGYKYALSKNWYIDAMIQIMAQDYYIRNNHNYRSGAVEIDPQLKIKAAYVFNRKH